MRQRISPSTRAFYATGWSVHAGMETNGKHLSHTVRPIPTSMSLTYKQMSHHSPLLDTLNSK